MQKSVVAVVKCSPGSVLEDIDRLVGLAGIERALSPATTILKDNISWHFPFPGANTTPWQLEGTVRALRARGFADLVCVQNKTVVTDAFKGEDLNGYLPIFKSYDIPVRYNFKPEDMSWSVYRPRARMNVLDQIYPEGILIPDDFHGSNIVHLPTTKCVAGDTEVVLADGTVATIRELVDRRIADAAVPMIRGDLTCADGQADVCAMDTSGRTGFHRATRFARSRRAGRPMVRVRTRTGRSLTATTDHPLFTPFGWQPLGALAVGQRVAIARRVPVEGRAQPLPQTFASIPIPPATGRAGRTYTAEFAQMLIDEYRAGKTVTAVAAAAGVRWQSVQSILHRHDVPLHRNVVPIQLPAHTSASFCRWLGYLMAEGCVESLERGAGKVWWTNSRPELQDDFVGLTSELFGVEARRRARGQFSIYSRDLVRFLEQMGLPVPLRSGNKLVPPILFRCSDEEIAAFLSGYLDGDGHVSAKQAEISATTKSERLAHDLQILLARLGVVAFVRPVLRTIPGRWSEPRTYHQVVVSGAAVGSLSQVLTLRHPDKAARLVTHANRLATSKQPSNWDVVPLPSDVLRRVREGLGLTQQATGMASTVNAVENSHRAVTPRIARGLIEVLATRDVGGRFAQELAALRTLASEDLAWDVIQEVDEVPLDEEVELFDLTVPGADSFVASGLIVHNCHIYTTTTGAMKNAFGGLLNTKRHYTHSWIHATLVDLLAIQKEIHSGLFAVMDGTTAGDGPGPRTMRPVIKDVMLAAEDQVAIDAVAASMMGFDPMTIDYIRLADEQGLGNGRRENIEVVGDAHLADERWGFSVGDNGASRVGDVMWFGPLKRFQKLFFHTPLVKLFVLGSEVYHDYYRWPLRDRQVFEAWRAETHWGRLFDRYQQTGTLGSPASEARAG
jgi:intein/homing endonuclease